MNLASHTHLALLAAAVSEAVRAGICDLAAPNLQAMNLHQPVLFDAALGSVPLRVCMGGWRLDELRFAIAAWPTSDVDQWIEAFGANGLAGDVTAIGYLIRGACSRIRLSDPFQPAVFMRRSRVAAMKALPSPDDAIDPLQLYPRYLSYPAAA